MANKTNNNAYHCPKCGKQYYGPLQLETGELCCPLCGKSIVPDFCVTAKNEEEYRLGESCYLSYLESFALGNANEQLRNRALDLYRRAAYAGHPEAIMRMGYFYEKHLNYGGVINSQIAALNFYKKVIGDYDAILNAPDSVYMDYIKYVLGESGTMPRVPDPIRKAYLDYVLGMTDEECMAFVGCNLRDVDTRRVSELTRRNLLEVLGKRVEVLRTKTAYYVYELSHFMVDDRGVFDDTLKEAIKAILHKDELPMLRYKNEGNESGDAFFVEVAAQCKELRDYLGMVRRPDPDGNTPLFGFLQVGVQQANAIIQFNRANHIFPDALYYKESTSIANRFRSINLLLDSGLSASDGDVILYFYNRDCTRPINGRKVKGSHYDKFILPRHESDGSFVLHDYVFDRCDPLRMTPGVVYYIDDIYYYILCGGH